jgi:tRNA G18 (ribose-2'-O)-methylase SpoU
LFKHEDWESFAKASPHGAVWVAVEMGSGSVPLQDFVHPPRAVYVLGSEDNGLNRPIVEACQCHVSLPKWVGRSSSYNVATAGALVMYDRLVKRLRDGAYDARSDE